MAWLTQEGFRDLVISNWPERGDENIQNFWKDIKTSTRRFSKGWGANLNSQMKKDKNKILEKLKMLDRETENNNLDESKWQQRYEWEK
jgi:hypothetical protein